MIKIKLMKTHTYKGEIIEKNPATGYWVCLCYAYGGYLKADTLRGIKSLIKQYKK